MFMIRPQLTSSRSSNKPEPLRSQGIGRDLIGTSVKIGIIRKLYQLDLFCNLHKAVASGLSKQAYQPLCLAA